MSYGRTAEQEIRLTGRRLLNRHFYGDGRWGWRPRSYSEQREYRGWTVTKTRPKSTTWAKSTGRLARKVHAIRYTLTAVGPASTTVHLTVWWCGAHALSEPLPESHPTVVCAGCHARLTGARDVVLEETNPCPA